MKRVFVIVVALAAVGAESASRAATRRRPRARTVGPGALRAGSEASPAASAADRTESFNGKLRDELLDREIFYSLAEARVLIERWRRHYNTERPHSSLGYRPPAPETIGPPCWPVGSATLRLPASMAGEAPVH